MQEQKKACDICIKKACDICIQACGGVHLFKNIWYVFLKKDDYTVTCNMIELYFHSLGNDLNLKIIVSF